MGSGRVGSGRVRVITDLLIDALRCRRGNDQQVRQEEVETGSGTVTGGVGRSGVGRASGAREVQALVAEGAVRPPAAFLGGDGTGPDEDLHVVAGGGLPESQAFLDVAGADTLTREAAGSVGGGTALARPVWIAAVSPAGPPPR
ncbi:hypothetical protein GCM10008937_22340 [Deinococcus depolymerans]|uniref:Uncharacterized protein n=1 Tax=Deinococcus depolymerans TaxID=392408 RepID=A0ABN1C8T6_9DEIO